MNSPRSLEEMKQLAAQVRRDIVRMVYAAQSGHPGGSLGCVEYLVALYFHHLRYQPDKFSMDGKGEDLFFLSNGHISPLLYSCLARSGYFPVPELNTFRKLNSRLQGHPATAEGLPGVRVATGSLGQGVSVAIGAAMAKKMNHDEHLVYVLMGDGELNEGQIWEAAMFAAHHKVDNLIAAVDWNHKQIDGDTRDVMDSGDLRLKFQAFGWEVVDVPNANQLEEVVAQIGVAQQLCHHKKPVVLLLHTIMGKGVDYMEDRFEWHGKPPTAALFEQAMAQLPATLGDY